MTEQNAEPRGTPVDELAGGPGVSHIDPGDPAAPNYEMISRLRSPLTLRDIMIGPVRSGYVGQDHKVDPSLLPPSPAELFPDVQVDEVYATSPDGPIRCQVYRSDGTSESRPPVMLYFHGGGFMVGRSEDTEFLTRKLCAQNDIVVVSVNYRLAPEWPFPIGLDDCVAAYRWVLEQGAARLDVDVDRVIFGGDSSGANFAATAALRSRDTAGLPMPAAVVMLGPVCDFRFEEYDSFNEMAPMGIVYDAAFAGFMRGGYVRHEDWSHPHVSPIEADLRGFPPAFVAVGTEDPMLDSARSFARRLKEGGEVRLFVSDGMPHGFYFFPRLFHQEEEAYEAVRAFLHEHVTG